MIIYHYFGSIGLCLLCGLLSSLLEKRYIKITGFRLALKNIPNILFFVYLIISPWFYFGNPNNLYIMLFLALAFLLSGKFWEIMGLLLVLLVGVLLLF